MPNLDFFKLEEPVRANANLGNPPEAPLYNTLDKETLANNPLINQLLMINKNIPAVKTRKDYEDKALSASAASLAYLRDINKEEIDREAKLTFGYTVCTQCALCNDCDSVGKVVKCLRLVINEYQNEDNKLVRRRGV